MKKLFSLLLVLVMGLSLCACGSAELGETLKYANNGEFVVNDISLYTQEDLMQTGYFAMLSALNSDEGVILVDFTMENTGKVDFNVKADKVVADYDDGVKYETDLLYHKVEGGEYEFCQHGYKLEKVTSDAEDFTVIIRVPLKVLKDTEKSLNVEVYYQTFEIR